MTTGEAFRAFRSRVEAQCPADLSIDVRAPESDRKRAVCGEHGRVAPTFQNLCPKCGGYVMPADEVAKLRALGRRLIASGLYDRAEVARRRVSPFLSHTPQF